MIGIPPHPDYTPGPERLARDLHAQSEDFRNLLSGYLQAALVTEAPADNPEVASWSAIELDDGAFMTMAVELYPIYWELVPLATASVSKHGPALWSEMGRDLWLTRNNHGAGFWDGDWPETGDQLTQIAQGMGEISLVRGSNGLLFWEG